MLCEPCYGGSNKIKRGLITEAESIANGVTRGGAGISGGKTKLDRNNTDFPLKLFEFIKETKITSEYDFLKYYQNITRIVSTEAEYNARGILIKYEMGVGKTLLAIAIAMETIKDKPVICLLSKSLQGNMRSSIIKYISMRKACEPGYYLAQLLPAELDAWIDRNFSFVSFNASNMSKQMEKAVEGISSKEFDSVLDSSLGEVVKLVDLSGKHMIVDEAHEFFRAITNGSKNATSVYNMIMQSVNLTLSFLTGSPITHDPFAFIPCFNMLGSRKPGDEIFPINYEDFQKLFVDPVNKCMKNKHIFQNRIMGLVSHVTRNSTVGKALGLKESATDVKFPDELPQIVRMVPMESTQFAIYMLARDKELEESKRASGKQSAPRGMVRPKSSKATSYRVRSRSLSNVYFPGNEQDKVIKSLTIPSSAPDSSTSSTPVSAPNSSTPPTSSTPNTPSKEDDDNEEDEILKADIATVTTTIEKASDEIISPKYDQMYEDMQKHRGTLGIVYSQFIKNGIGGYARYLVKKGWRMLSVDDIRYRVSLSVNKTGGTSAPHDVDAYLENVNAQLSSSTVGGADDNDLGDDIEAVNLGDDEEDKTGEATNAGETEQKQQQKKRKVYSSCFMMHTGQENAEDRAIIESMMRLDDNMHGEVCELLLTSSVGAQGLDLPNIRYLMQMEPYWDKARDNQFRARGPRANSHIKLPKDEQNVQPYIYISVPPPEEKIKTSTDLEIYEAAIDNQVIIDDFVSATVECCIECIVNEEASCRVCVPNNQPLFSSDIFSDSRRDDPCKIAREAKVQVEKIQYDDEEYYYKSDETSIFRYKVFIKPDNINNFIAMRENDARFIPIIKAIQDKK